MVGKLSPPTRSNCQSTTVQNTHLTTDLKYLESALDRWVNAASNPLFREAGLIDELVLLLVNWSGATAENVLKALDKLINLKPGPASAFVAESQTAPGVQLSTVADKQAVRLLHYQVLDGPVGRMLVAEFEGQITELHLIDVTRASTNEVITEALAVDWIRQRWPVAELVHADLKTDVNQLFNPESTQERASVLVMGTPFQQAVWQALATIPTGEVTTYGRLAKQLNLPETAARAIGQAVGANPIAWLIPCHRVVQASGQLGDFRWGLAKKRLLLLCEMLLKTS